MHPLRLTFALVAAFAVHALAAPIDVTKGFAGATWGMSPAEVAKATGAVDAGFVSRVYPDVPTVILVKRTEANQLSTCYVCYDGKLVQIYRLSALDIFGINPQNFVTSNLTSDGSIQIEASMEPNPHFLPDGVFKSFNVNVGTYNFAFSLAHRSLRRSIYDAWHQGQVEKLQSQTLPKLLK
jgi:hypothetical protein